MVKCAICGTEMKVINPKHVVSMHGVSMAEYRKLYPNEPTSSDPDYYLKRASKGRETILTKNPDWYKIQVGKNLREGHARKMEEDPEYREHFLQLQKDKVKIAWDEDHKLSHVKNLKSSCGSMQVYKGYKTKSFGERLMIDHLESLGVDFEFESVILTMEDGHGYVPDFYIRSLNLLIEVKSDPDSIYFTEYDLYKHDQSIKQGYDHIIVFNYKYEDLDKRITTGCTATK